MRLFRLILLGILLGAGPAPVVRANRTPSTELSFRAALQPDSITVGDPMTLTVEAAGPEKATLMLPAFSDSVGPFTVLSAGAPTSEVKDGRVRLRQTVRLTLFRTGRIDFPELPLLWARGPEDSLAAYSQPIPVRVRSVLPKNVKGLQDLHALKGVVPLGRSLLGLWILMAVVAAAGAFLLWRFRHRLRRRGLLPEAPLPPPLPPEEAFEQGLDELYRRQLPEQGLVKEFYAELSLLFRRYLEDRFTFPAVEETRTEIMLAAAEVVVLVESERLELSRWLDEGDLVKFAKMERLLAESRNYAERAREWVRGTALPRGPALPPMSPADHAEGGQS